MATSERDRRLRMSVQVTSSLALVVFIFWYVLRQFADLSEIWDAMRSLSPLEIAVLVIASALNLFTYWILNMIATPGLTLPQSIVMTESTTVVSNAVPAAGAGRRAGRACPPLTTTAAEGQVVPSRATAATTRSRSTLPMNRPP